ncbi:MAG: hypothetical protein AB7G93_14215 [Bdellovibrionales bacterium]
MKGQIACILGAAGIAGLIGCSGGMKAAPVQSPVEVGFTIQGVVKGRAVLQVSTDKRGDRVISSESGKIPISIVNGPDVHFSVDTSTFQIPEIANAVLDFGSLGIADLFDNDLKVCGANGKKKCSLAFIRVYTTGTPGPGLYNLDENYGLPITSRLDGGIEQTVGLDQNGAAVMQTVPITNKMHVLRLADFSPTPVYFIKSDFTQAGSGDFSTTLVIEYGLAE